MIITYLKTIVVGCNNHNYNNNIKHSLQKISIQSIINQMDLSLKKIFIKCLTEK